MFKVGLDLPVVSGHRGYKGKFPENTILGFEKCFITGATHFETDLYLTTDNVIVICHDQNTKRVYCHPNGDEADFLITKSSYEDDLKDLVNIETGDKLLTFQHLLKFLMSNENDGVNRQCMLDIKTYNKPKIIKHIFYEILLVKNDVNYWLPKLQFGVWDLNFVKYLNQDDYFQELYKTSNITEKLQLYHISGSWNSSLEFIGYNHYLDQVYGKERQLFKINGVSLLYLLTWSRGFLQKFMPVVKLENISLFTWTVNNTYQYDYFNKICQVYKLLEYGIMSDDPGLMMDHKLSDHNNYNQSNSEPNLDKVHNQIPLDFQQKLANFGFEMFLLFAPKPPLNYSETVDPELIKVPRVNPLLVKLFVLCQRFGLM